VILPSPTYPHRKALVADIASLQADKAGLEREKQSLLEEYETKMTGLLQSLQAVERSFVQQREE
jgi:hypothetical protein